MRRNLGIIIFLTIQFRNVNCIIKIALSTLKFRDKHLSSSKVIEKNQLDATMIY